MASSFPTTLLILYFITSPAHIPPGEKKVQEIKANWTLQTTSQLQTEDPNSCVSLGKKMIKEFEPVNTSTIRLYCICPKEAVSEVCFNQEEKKKARERKAAIERNESNPSAEFVAPKESRPIRRDSCQSVLIRKIRSPRNDSALSPDAPALKASIELDGTFVDTLP
jgi:hypothetical protein